jgi:hypothetical protein
MQFFKILNEKYLFNELILQIDFLIKRRKTYPWLKFNRILTIRFSKNCIVIVCNSLFNYLHLEKVTIRMDVQIFILLNIAFPFSDKIFILSFSSFWFESNEAKIHFIDWYFEWHADKFVPQATLEMKGPLKKNPFLYPRTFSHEDIFLEKFWWPIFISLFIRNFAIFIEFYR